jgi:hypothetical protein
MPPPLPQYPAHLPVPLRAAYGSTPAPRHERTALGGPVEHVEEVFAGSTITVPHHVIATSTQAFELRAWVIQNKANVNWVLMPANIGFGLQLYEARLLRLDVPHDLTGISHWSIPFDLEIRAKADGSYWDISEEEADVVLGGFLYIDDNILVG